MTMYDSLGRIMKNAAMAMLIFCVPLLVAQTPKYRPQEGKLKVGDAMPVVTLEDLAGKNKVNLAGLKNKPVILIFGSCT